MEFTVEQWEQVGTELYGEKKRNWKFICPSCGHIATAKEWKDAGAGEGEIGFSCIGRRVEGCKGKLGAKKGPCNYAGGGLFQLNPLFIKDPEGQVHRLFAFADMNVHQMAEKFGGLALEDTCKNCGKAYKEHQTMTAACPSEPGSKIYHKHKRFIKKED